MFGRIGAKAFTVPAVLDRIDAIEGILEWGDKGGLIESWRGLDPPDDGNCFS